MKKDALENEKSKKYINVVYLVGSSFDYAQDDVTLSVVEGCCLQYNK